MQEFDCTIVYWKGHENGNVDVLSKKPVQARHSAAATTVPDRLVDIQQHQSTDPVICQLRAGEILIPT